MEADLQAFGAPPEVLAAWADAQSPEAMIVYPGNHDTVRLFLRLQSQWRHTPSGRLAGLDYGAVRVLMDSLGRWPDDSLLQDIQTMEYAAVEFDAAGHDG